MQCTLSDRLCKEKLKSQLENSELKNMYSQTAFLLFKLATRIDNFFRRGCNFTLIQASISSAI